MDVAIPSPISKEYYDPGDTDHLTAREFTEMKLREEGIIGRKEKVIPEKGGREDFWQKNFKEKVQK